LLDPCEVGDGWFRVSIPDFQLLVTERVPGPFQERAQSTLDRLQLRRGYHARWNRWRWYARHWNNGQVNLEALRIDAPLVLFPIRPFRSRTIQSPGGKGAGHQGIAGLQLTPSGPSASYRPGTRMR
jgi:hypothetical protein